mgnify:CR=1 FL=1
MPNISAFLRASDFMLSNPPYGKSCKSDFDAATHCHIRN